MSWFFRAIDNGLLRHYALRQHCPTLTRKTMIKSFADYHKVDSETFANTGALDPILSVDTKLFIDPSLLIGAETPELAESHARLENHFNDVLKVVVKISTEGDRMWREADRLLTFPEVKGLCIGYSSGGTSGSGMGPGLRAQLLRGITEIVRAGTSDPAIFELVGAFEGNIGPDRISDMVAKIILPDLISFTQRVCSECGIKMEPLRVSKDWHEEDLPLNPVTQGPVILVPKEILCELPVAESYADISWIAHQNEEMRRRLNGIIGGAWGKLTTTQRKDALKRGFVDVPEMLAMVIKAYRAAERNVYDFDSDPAGEVVWYQASKEVVHALPLKFQLPPEPTRNEVEGVVIAICEHFKRLLEDNQLCKLLYDKHGVKKHESAAQLLFYGIASAYCEANDLDLTAESDGGRGPVDFKASRGFREKVLVEVKLTTNQRLLHGYQSQLPIYQRAENTTRGIYLVIDNGGPEDRLKRLMQEVAAAGNDGPRVVVVDGKPRPSASIADE
jgi:hypothetical protein